MAIIHHSESTSKHIDNTYKGVWIPFDSHSSINFIIPITGSRKVEATVSLLHDDTVGNKFEVFVDSGDAFENLYFWIFTSSQIWLVHIWASFTL